MRCSSSIRQSQGDVLCLALLLVTCASSVSQECDANAPDDVCQTQAKVQSNAQGNALLQKKAATSKLPFDNDNDLGTFSFGDNNDGLNNFDVAEDRDKSSEHDKKKKEPHNFDFGNNDNFD